jgi:hypothetical protein
VLRGKAGRSAAPRHPFTARSDRPCRNLSRLPCWADLAHPDSSGRRPTREISPAIGVDDGLLLNQLAAWAPDAAVRRKILVDNPARLYGFG